MSWVRNEVLVCLSFTFWVSGRRLKDASGSFWRLELKGQFISVGKCHSLAGCRHFAGPLLTGGPWCASWGALQARCAAALGWSRLQGSCVAHSISSSLCSAQGWRQLTLPTVSLTLALWTQSRKAYTQLLAVPASWLVFFFQTVLLNKWRTPSEAVYCTLAVWYCTFCLWLSLQCHEALK